MKAQDRPIGQLIEKYQADPDSLSVDELQTLQKYKAMLQAQKDAAKAKKPGKSRPANRKPRRRKETLAARVERLRQADLDLIESKQQRGEALTESDRRALREIIATTSAPATVSKTHELVQGSIEKALQLARLKAFHRLVELIDSRREDVSLQASIALKSWADAEEPAAEPYTLAEANPRQAPSEPVHPEGRILSFNSGVA